MSKQAKNYEAIYRAKQQHNENCEYPPHTLLMHPDDIERMGWEEGENIAGLELKADEAIQRQTLRLLCDGVTGTPNEEEDVDAVGSELVSA